MVEHHSAPGGLEAKDYTNYLVFINSYMILLIVTYLLCFTTDYKRSEVRHYTLQLYYH